MAASSYVVFYLAPLLTVFIYLAYSTVSRKKEQFWFYLTTMNVYTLQLKQPVTGSHNRAERVSAQR